MASRKRHKTKEKKERNPNRQREKEIGIFFIKGLDYATSSFLALLVNIAGRLPENRRDRRLGSSMN